MVRCFPSEMNSGRAMISSAPSLIISGITSSILGSSNSLKPTRTLPYPISSRRLAFSFTQSLLNESLEPCPMTSTRVSFPGVLSSSILSARIWVRSGSSPKGCSI